MHFDEYRQHDATGLAALIAKGDVTATELLDIAIARADAVNPKLNGLIIPLYEQARQRANTPLSGPLAGVPFLVKDLFQEIKDAPHYLGNKAAKALNNISTFDSTIVRRWKSAGLVPFGRTNTPEFGAKGITEPESFGATRNPWNIEHTPGGSSGGSASLVAAGVVPAAGANDGGGSIRIPASHCGLFGLKPGRSRTPWGPEFTEAMHGMAVNHVVTRSVRDSALILDATHGDEIGSLFHITPPETSYQAAISAPPKKLRIGFSTRSPIGTYVDPEAIKAVEKTVALLTSLGHEVEEAEPQVDHLQMCMDWLLVWFGQCADNVVKVKELSGCGNSGFELDTLAMAAFGRAISGQRYARSQANCQLSMIAMDNFLQRYDFWLTPSVATPPQKIGSLDTPMWQQIGLKIMLTLRMEKLLMMTNMIEQVAIDSLQHTPYTQFANVTGVPAMSVPLHWCDNGLPLGVQFVGGHGDEGKLLSLAAQLEESTPWFHRVPPEL
ncbi:MAG: amidase [Alcanivoracaceae bacterium]|nr:amidase [Alcanivoracaceae bacterium]